MEENKEKEWMPGIPKIDWSTINKEEYYQDLINRVVKSDKKELSDYCYVGLIEWDRKGCSFLEGYFGSEDLLFLKRTDYGNYIYAVGHPFYGESYRFEEPISVVQFLRFLVSYDRIYIMDGRRISRGIAINNVKIKLKGMTEWIEQDSLFYEGKIKYPRECIYEETKDQTKDTTKDQGTGSSSE